LDAELERVTKERDLYRRLLALGEDSQPDAFVRDALDLVVGTAGAERGYLELRGPHDDDNDGDDDEAQRWSVSTGLESEELEAVRSAVSRGIVASAMASGETVRTSSAAVDSRFANRESVRKKKIHAVLCAPIGPDPAVGVIYLAAREGHAFVHADLERVELFARYVAALADRLLVRSRLEENRDHTRAARAKLDAGGILGHSRAIAATLREVGLVAPLDVSVLLTGDSGTGKSAIARVLHANSPRASKPFVEVNCAALPEPLVESELFGAAKGAHSTATQKTDGRIAAASGGTLFLDEISELPASAQAKLLQVLQDRVYYRLGDPRPITADVRIIAATNVDLPTAIKTKAFRQDLYYRLSVVPIRVPSLAERREDIALLAEHACERTLKRHNLPRLGLSVAATLAIARAEWPGNVRELLHAVEVATIRAAGEGAAAVTPAHVFPDRGVLDEPPAEATSFQDATRRFQAQLLATTLAANDWNIAATARQLVLHRSHVYNLIREFALKRD
jgi:transcriptional regulator with GAF, ATPase, and Fis domain